MEDQLQTATPDQLAPTVDQSVTNVLAYGASDDAPETTDTGQADEPIGGTPTVDNAQPPESADAGPAKDSFMEDIDKFLSGEPDKAATPSVPKNMFEVLSRKVSDENYKYEIPKFIETGQKDDGTPLTDDEAFDFLAHEIARHWDFSKQFENDKFLSGYLKAMESEGFDPQRYIESFTSVNTLLSLDNKELVFRDYMERKGKSETNPSGYTQEQIRDYVDKMNPLEIDEKAEGLRADISSRDLARSESSISPEQRIVQDRERVVTDIAIIDAMLDSKAEIDEIGGLPYGEAVKRDFNDFFKYMMTYNPEMGTKPFIKLVEDDEQVFQMMFSYYNLVSGNIKDFVSTMKEAVKLNMFEKLDLGPKTKRSGTAGPARLPTA